MRGRVVDLAAVAIVLLATGGSAVAQEPTAPDPAFLALSQRLSPGDRVTVTLMDGTTLEGRFARVGADGMTLRESGTPASIPAARIARVQRHKVGVLLGAIIGTGVGYACGRALGTLYSNEGHDPTVPELSLTGLGLGIGLGIDLALNLPRTVYRAGRTRTSPMVEVRPQRGGVSVAVGGRVTF